MCNCLEIQDRWVQSKSDGDFFKLISGSQCWYEDSGIELLCDEIHIFVDVVDLPEDAVIIWLPRQDQLQEMVRPQINKNYGESISYLHRQFTEWLKGENPEFETYEQLWLAFVMQRLHGKKWNGNEWIRE